MPAFNVVRFRVKPGREEEFVRFHHEGRLDAAGFQGGHLIKTGDRAYCMIGQWDKLDSMIAARPTMIALLDGLRDMLEDLGGGLGVTDPVSGEAVASLPAAR